MAGGLESFTILYYLWILGLAATHISLTVIVYRDAQQLRRSALRISPLLWGGVAFSLPVAGMFVYWLMNYSILSVESKRWSTKDETVKVFRER